MMRRGNTAKNLLMYIMVPVAVVTLTFLAYQAYERHLASIVKGLFSGVDQGWRELEYSQKEVERLKVENARLATENQYYANLTRENPRLREMSGFKEESRYKLQACRVVGRDPANWWNSVTINVGWNDEVGMVSDLPVVSPRGVVGKTGIVWPSVTEVILMVNPNCKVSSVLETTKEKGIVVGMGGTDGSIPLVKMRYISKSAELGVGERVFTSGLGGVFPPGLFLGTVSEVPPLSSSVNFGLYRELVVEPAVDLSELDELFIVLGAKP